MRKLSLFLLIAMPLAVLLNAFFAFHGYVTNGVVAATLSIQYLAMYRDLRGWL